MIVRFRTYLFFLTFFIFSLGNVLFGVEFGSDVAVSRQALVTFLAADINNRMLGFAAFEAGFILEDATTTCTFDAFYPISGTVTLNDGTLFLNQDLALTNSLYFFNTGKIDGQDNKIELPETLFDIYLPQVSAGGPLIFKDATLVLNSHVVVHQDWRFQGSCKLLGHNKRLVIEDGRVFEIGDNATVEFHEIDIRNVGGSNLRCITDSGSISLNHAEIYLDRNFTFSKGGIVFDHEVLITGTNKFNYTTVVTSTISAHSHLVLDDGVTFSYDPANGRNDLLYMEDVTAVLILEGATLHSTQTGLHLSTGTLCIDNKVTLSSEARNTGEAMMLSSDLEVEALGGAILDIFGIVKYE